MMKTDLKSLVRRTYHRSVDALRSVRRAARSQIAAASVLTFLLSVVMGVAVFSLNSVIIRDGDSYQVVKTYRTEVDEILLEAGVTLGEYDELVESENPAFFKDLQVLRAFPVSITCDGSTVTKHVTSGTVQNLLDLAGVTLGENDLITAAPETPLRDGMSVKVSRVTYQTEAVDTAIPYETKRVNTASLLRGKEEVSTEGKEGLSRTTYQLMYVDGELAERRALGTEVVSQPVDKTIKVGTGVAPSKPAYVTVSRSDLGSTRYIDMRATAYTYGCGTPGDITASGKPARVGLVAVDPRVIPLGTRLYIETPSGGFTYGYAVAADTGGGIKGNRIDLFMETYRECINFGVRTVRVYILD